MKVFKVTAKNLKLLMRSKTSMLVVVFGPLIIMLLVGFAFNNNTTSKLNIGYYSAEKTELTTSFVDALISNPNFLLISYASDTQCIDMIHQGKVHLCIIFPNDFSIENNKSNELQFYVDQSRANFVYAVIDTVSSKISLTSEQLSYQMTNDLITVIDNTKRSNTEQLAKITKIKNSITDVSTKLGAVQSQLGELDFSGADVDMDPVDKASVNLENSINELTTLTEDLVETSEDLATNLNGNTKNSTYENILDDFASDVTAFKSDANTTINATEENLNLILDALETVSTDVDLVLLKLSEAKDATGDSIDGIENNVKALSQLKTSIDELKSLIETNNAQINALKVTSAQSIVNPIKTTIKPVSGKSGNLSFIFPYFIILIIVFIGIMLSSSLIIMEKTSKAYFRNFTTPTKDLTFVMSVFFTSFIVVLLQLVFILGLAYFFLNTAMFSNLILTVVLILGAITLFTLVGMVIGYAFNNQEAVTMASISVGSIFLFLSNLILPLETMSPVIQQIARYNPYVLCSELLKKLTLFESTIKEVYMDYVFIAVYIVVLFTLVMIVEKASKVQFISKKPITKQLARQKGQQIEKYFKLKNGVLLMSEKDLMEELRTMTDKEFEMYVNKKKNDFESWLMMNSKKTLAEKIGACETRKEMMAALGASMDKIDPIAAAGIDKLEREKSGKDSSSKEDKEDKKKDKE
ncbi:MAG: ABC transporter permease [Candidatus Woesearchaeota archaeon]